VITAFLASVSNPFATRAAEPAGVPVSEEAVVEFLPGHRICLRVETAISTRISKTNDPLFFTVIRPAMVGRMTVIERGTAVRGHIQRITPGRARGRPGEVWIKFEDVPAVDNTRVSVSLSSYEGSPAGDTPWPQLETGNVDTATLWTAPIWIPILLAHQLGKRGGDFEAPKGETLWVTVIGSQAGAYRIRARCIPTDAMDMDVSTAIRQGSADRVKALLAQGADIHTFSDKVLADTAERGQAEVVEVLLDRGIEREERSSALIRAANAGRLSVVESLLTHMDDIASADMVLIAGAALMSAAREGHALVLEKLLGTGVDSKAKNAALVEAASGGHITAVEILLAHGADLNARALDSTALIQAVKYDHVALTRLLLDRGANPKLKDGLGYTAGRYAAEYHRIELARALKQASQAR
jgi:ankyrin repeat protein